MTIVDDFYTRLNASAPLVALLTGGLYKYRDLPSSGISRASLPAAYTAGSNGKLKPILVIKARALVPAQGANSLKDGTYTSTRQVVEVWFYNDAAAGWVTIASAAALAYALLQGQPTTGTFDLNLVNEVHEERAPEMSDACFERYDYEVIGRKT